MMSRSAKERRFCATQADEVFGQLTDAEALEDRGDRPALLFARKIGERTRRSRSGLPSMQRFDPLQFAADRIERFDSDARSNRAVA